MRMEIASLLNDIPILESTSLLPLITLYTHGGLMQRGKKREYHIEELLKSWVSLTLC
jgi:hypothetical protein